MVCKLQEYLKKYKIESAVKAMTLKCLDEVRRRYEGILMDILDNWWKWAMLVRSNQGEKANFLASVSLVTRVNWSESFHRNRLSPWPGLSPGWLDSPCTSAALPWRTRTSSPASLRTSCSRRREPSDDRSASRVQLAHCNQRFIWLEGLVWLSGPICLVGYDH